jgi:uncharacterized protein DUF2608
MKIFHFSIFVLFFSFSLLANIIEHNKFACILDYIKPEDCHKNTLVILDIDNTIATLGQPFQWLGGDAWITYEINKLMQEGLSYKEATARILPFYFELTHFVELIPVEPTTITIIKQLQEAGITVIACTIRSIDIMYRTIEQLKMIGIDLMHSAFGYEELSCHEPRFCYKNGIIFCHGGNKGITLANVLEHFDHTPTKVIVIDDKEKYLHQIKNVLNPEIEFIGIRYGYLDETVAQFDPIVAELEKQTYLAAKELVI